VRFALLALLIPSVAIADTASDTTAAAGDLVSAIKRHDAKTIAARLATPFKYNGAWFPDAACTKRFGHAGVLQTKDRDAFARCFAKLVPQLSTRASNAKEGAVITVEPGIEMEVRFIDGQVRWLGLAGAGDDKGTPMLTAQAFEALRTKGTTLLDDAVRAELEPELVKANPLTAWIRTCLDEKGTATRTYVWGATLPTGDPFMRATADWAFKPYTVRGVATPVCSLSLLTYPASRAPSVEVLPPGLVSGPRVVSYDFEDDLDLMAPWVAPISAIATIQPAELAALSTTPLDPKPATPMQLLHAPRDRTSDVNVCIDVRGGVKNVVTMSQLPGDRTRAGKIWHWRFKPYLVNGTPTEACALLQFIVTP
jgi:hypothetical protein